MISGVTFLAGNPNPHYAPFEINGGKDWMRARLTSGSIRARELEPELF